MFSVGRCFFPGQEVFMFKAKYLTEHLVERSPFIILALLLLVTTSLPNAALSKANNNEEQKKVVRQVAQKWIQIGTEQFQRSFFKAAEQSFLRAKEYQDYLTAEEQQKLNKLIEETHVAVLERQRILEHIQTADKLIEQGELTKAKTHLESVKDNKFLTEAERKQISEGLKKVDSTPTEQPKEQSQEIVNLYMRSVELYNAGQLEEARKGFVKVAQSGLLIAPAGQTPQDYLILISEKTQPNTDPQKSPTEPIKVQQPVKAKQQNEPVVSPQPVVSAQSATDTGLSYIQKVNLKRDVRRSYTNIVVNDAAAKAQNYLAQNEFDKAQEVIESAKRTVYGNQMDLGEILIKQYDSKLQELSDEIALRKEQRDKLLDQEKRIAAIDAAQERKTQMEDDRNRRITELMENAVACQAQMRYEEALGQLESLLALDPMNNNALILKQTLEDTVNFRKQLEVERERNKARADILRKTDEAGIPHPEEMTYPKNWREIIAKPTRKPEEPLGLEEADKEVYNQLDEVVDLSALTPVMTLSEAIEELKNSVEPPLKVFVLWRDLSESANIEPDTPINIDGIPAIRLGTGLENLLKAVSGGFIDLDYVVQNAVITIATVDSLPSKMVTRVYDVTDLLGQPAQFRMGMLGMGMMGGGVGGAGGGG